MTSTTKAAQKAVNKYIKNNYDRINLTIPKGMKGEIRKYAEEAGFDSMNQFIIHAINSIMESKGEFGKEDESEFSKDVYELYNKLNIMDKYDKKDGTK